MEKKVGATVQVWVNRCKPWRFPRLKGDLKCLFEVFLMLVGLLLLLIYGSNCYAE